LKNLVYLISHCLSNNAGKSSPLQRDISSPQGKSLHEKLLPYKTPRQEYSPRTVPILLKVHPENFFGKITAGKFFLVHFPLKNTLIYDCFLNKAGNALPPSMETFSINPPHKSLIESYSHRKSNL